MLTGGGARAAYQVGLLKGLARQFPQLDFNIITGASAGAINAIFLAAKQGSLAQRAEALSDLWCSLQCHHVFRTNYTALLPFWSAVKSVFPRKFKTPKRAPHGILDSSPLGRLLRDLFDVRRPGDPIAGINRNLSENLHAIAILALDYSTGQSVRWVQGHNNEVYEGPNRRSAPVQMTVEHILASAALPFVFPAVCIDDRWYGDGGIRLAAPLSPAVHLGARRILAMSTGYQRTPDEASTPVVYGYPPAAQILGQLVNAVFLDVIDEDVARMERMNEMIHKIDASQRNGFKPIELCVLRPSVDIGKLAGDYESQLPASLKLLTRSLGTKETEVPDLLSLLMFVPDYVKRLIEIGEQDVELRIDDLRRFFGEEERPQFAAG